MQFKKFTTLFLGLFLTISVLAIAFNLVIDPFDVYRVVRKDEFNAVKPMYESYTRLAKVIQVERFPKETVALGSSRTQFGIDMKHPFLSGSGEPGWNLALNGSHMYETARLFDHVVATTNTKKVLIGLDFFMFNALTEVYFDDESYFSIDRDGKENYLHQLKQLALTLVNIDAFEASIKTLRKQKESRFDDHGRKLSSRERAKILRRNGVRSGFLKHEAAYAREAWTPCIDNNFVLRKKDGTGSLGWLESLLKKAATENIEVILFISPSHARLWETLDGAGLWGKFELWKVELARSLSGINEATGRSFELWDFSGFNSFTTEAVPKDNVKMKWYIDASHYGVELGRLMLDVISGKRSATDNDGATFGRKLSSESVDRVIADIRKEKEAFKKNFPELINVLHRGAAAQLDERLRLGKVCS